LENLKHYGPSGVFSRVPAIFIEEEELNREGTTPTDFKSNFNRIRSSFNFLRIHLTLTQGPLIWSFQGPAVAFRPREHSLRPCGEHKNRRSVHAPTNEHHHFPATGQQIATRESDEQNMQTTYRAYFDPNVAILLKDCPDCPPRSRPNMGFVVLDRQRAKDVALKRERRQNTRLSALRTQRINTRECEKQEMRIWPNAPFEPSTWPKFMRTSTSMLMKSITLGAPFASKTSASGVTETFATGEAVHDELEP
jgi:hypothetical protein